MKRYSGKLTKKLISEAKSFVDERMMALRAVRPLGDRRLAKMEMSCDKGTSCGAVVMQDDVEDQLRSVIFCAIIDAYKAGDAAAKARVKARRKKQCIP